MKSSCFRLLAGLGNPGSRFTGTRHNIGFMALSRFAEKQNVSFKQQKKLQGLVADMHINSETVRLLMPNTFMNESGQAIRAALDWFDLSITNLLVILDDMDLPLGKLRLRSQGSSGGHNGLRSTIQHLGTDHFYRLRIGIGAPSDIPTERKSKTVSHVLGSFTEQEKQLVEQVLDEVIIGLDLIQTVGIERASNRINSFKPKV